LSTLLGHYQRCRSDAAHHGQMGIDYGRPRWAAWAVADLVGVADAGEARQIARFAKRRKESTASHHPPVGAEPEQSINVRTRRDARTI